MTMRNNSTQWPGGKPPDHVLEYVDWLIVPESMRQPKSKQAWADEHGVHVRTLNDWEHDDRVKWQIRERADALNMGPERVQAVMNALWNRALVETQAAKLYLDHVDKIMPRDGEAKNGFEEMSDEDLAELAKEVLSGSELHG